MTALTELFHRSTPVSAGSPGVALFTAIATVKTWRERAVQRRALALLSPELLRDLGLSPIEARIEAEKPFWMA